MVREDGTQGSFVTHITLGLMFWLFAASTQAAEPASGIDFEQQIQPILEEKCLPCHDDATRTSGLSVLTPEDLLAGGARQGPAVVPGHPENSVLLRMLRGELAPQMPFGQPALPEEQVQLIAKWVEQLRPELATDQDTGTWWAYEPPKEPPIPQVQRESWPRRPIDYFILRKLEEENLQPAPEATKQVLLRRVFFDLVGMPPTHAEAREFLEDESPFAYEKLIDRLLADPRYGERWGRHWLDLARYADTMGFEADRENYHMWRYRDYVIEAFNEDKPFDQFIREQLAGDEIDPENPEKLIATGFLRLGPVFQTTIAKELRQLLLNEITSTVGSVFLGLTVGCAQCHDHKYDPLPQKDFYRLQAFFLPVHFKEVEVPFTDPGLAQRLDERREEAEERLRKADQAFEAYEKKLMAKLRKVYESEGRSTEKPTSRDLKSKLVTGIANALVPSDDPTFTLEEKQKYLELVNLRDERMGGRDMGMYRRQVERTKPKAHVVQNPTVSGFAPDMPQQFVRVRGEYNHLGERVEPGYPSALATDNERASLPADKFGNVRKWRISLANWIASPDNPLTARVMVNRIWQHHFGRGIVATSSDFGKNGARPTHPELLDWLAREFIDSGWSTKAMHRLMMTSATYRQSSRQASKQAQEVDSANRLLWRMRRKRLEGEVIRDSILAVSGRLNLTMQGPGFFPPLPEGVKTKIKNIDAWEPSTGPESRRRSVYIFQRRQIEVPFMTLMDTPVLQAPRDKRDVSTTALQALTLMNGRLVTQEAEFFARRVEREAGADPEDQIRRAFQLALARPPTKGEFTRAREFLSSEGESGLAGLCRVLYNSNEFVYVD